MRDWTSLFIGILAGLSGGVFYAHKLSSHHSKEVLLNQRLNGRSFADEDGPCVQETKKLIERLTKSRRTRFIYDQGVVIVGGFYSGHKEKVTAQVGDGYSVHITDVEEPFDVEVDEEQLADWAIFDDSKQVTRSGRSGGSHWWNAEITSDELYPGSFDCDRCWPTCPNTRVRVLCGCVHKTTARSHVLFWTLNLYLEHGDKWRETAVAELNRIKAEHQQQKNE